MSNPDLVVLFDTIQPNGAKAGMMLQFGNELEDVVDNINAAVKSLPPEIQFEAAHIVELHNSKPDVPYIPNNSLGGQMDRSGAVQSNNGKVWFKLVMMIAGGEEHHEEE